MNYPDIDAGFYCAAIKYDGVDRAIIFPGGYEKFTYARDRSRKLRDALRGAGEVGVKAMVVFEGERPSGFPRNGVIL